MANPEEHHDMPLLLIADDNAAIREVLAGLFSSDFKILQAVNGKEALKMAKKEVPDILICDVMMPEMDGFELTNTLKNNEITSFIPIILLTAKTGNEAHLQGLKSQADTFLTKPFDNLVLQATVKNLLAERAKLRERFSRELVLKPMDVVLNSADEKFLGKLQAIIEEKLQNPDFSAEGFASTLGMSRMQLHRKLKSLIGLSATEFIRKERLKMAAVLLKHKTFTISEVAFSVGFNDADYFTKCFKEEFGATPSQFSAQE
jgi:YesN/AraC family two-component response regulator